MNYPYPDLVRQDILALIPDDGQVIGSIGCGSGATESTLITQGREVHGVDINPEAIGLAATRLTSARVVAPDERRPFHNESLDGLVLADVIEHLPFAWDALRDFSLAVKPGGWVAISVPNMRNIDTLLQFWIKGDWPEQPLGIFDATHLQVMSKQRLERWATASGLDAEYWHKHYERERRRRYAVLRTMNALTFGLCWPWFMYQLQCRFRKRNRK